MFLKDGDKSGVPADFKEAFKKTVVFELADSQGGYNAAAGKKQFPVSRGILPFFSVSEKGKDDKQKEVFNHVEWRFATNKIEREGAPTEYLPQSIDFMSGRIVCDPDQKDALVLYWILMNHPRNSSNKNRDKTLTPYFFKVDPALTAREEIKLKRLLNEAENLILDEGNLDVLRQLALHYDCLNVFDLEAEQLQKFLLGVMKNNPEAFIEQAKSKQTSMRANITKAMALGVVILKNDEWFWGENVGEEKRDTPICKLLSKNDDAKLRLIRFLDRAKDESGDFFGKALEEAEMAKAIKEEEGATTPAV